MPPKSATKEKPQSSTKKDKSENDVISTSPYPDVTSDTSIDFDSINEILKNVFKHEGFRTELQRDAVVEACQFKRDLFVSLPTGSGKSLIYQLPAMYKNQGLTIVVSPLVALISNQITNAKKLGIPCATINSHMTKQWNAQVKAELSNKDSKLRLLYITPETLCSDHFQPHLSILHRNKRLKLFAIDEAHCVSSWGHEFRPDYLKLGQLRTRYPDVPIIALTATATSKVLKDILNTLNLNDPKHIIASTFRKNLFYDVRVVDDLEKGALNDLTSFMIDCLQLKKLGTSTKTTTSDPKRRKVDDSLVTSSSAVGSTANGSGSQFVSAAALLTTEKPKVPKKSLGKKVTSSHSLILAKEKIKITSFFKPKLVEVIDLCSDNDDDKKDEVVEVKPNDCKKKKDINQNDTFLQYQDDDVKIEVSRKEEEVSNLPLLKKIRKAHVSTKTSFVKACDLSMNDSLTEPSTTSGREPSLKDTRAGYLMSANGVAIVYCRTKLSCEDVAAHLNMKGISARPYHSGLNSKERSEIETLWMEEKVLVICATISFGMGIDKANVRCVVHYNMSQSLANYYQESGRAGRDGKQAYCRLYYSKSDQSAISFLLRKDLEMDDEGKFVEKYGAEACKRKQQTAKASIERFERMIEYCKSLSKCRHLILAKEFALANETEFLKNGCGGSCDYCRFQSKVSSSSSPSGKGAASSRRGFTIPANFNIKAAAGAAARSPINRRMNIIKKINSSNSSSGSQGNWSVKFRQQHLERKSRI